MVPWHMGALHPYEQALTLLLAFGPFVLLGIVVWRRGRSDEPEGHDAPGGHGAPGGHDAPEGPDGTLDQPVADTDRRR